MVEIHRVSAHENQIDTFSPVLYTPSFYLAIYQLLLKLLRRTHFWTESCLKSCALQRPLYGAGTKGPVRMDLHLTLLFRYREGYSNGTY